MAHQTTHGRRRGQRVTDAVAAAAETWAKLTELRRPAASLRFALQHQDTTRQATLLSDQGPSVVRAAVEVRAQLTRLRAAIEQMDEHDLEALVMGRHQQDWRRGQTDLDEVPEPPGRSWCEYVVDAAGAAARHVDDLRERLADLAALDANRPRVGRDYAATIEMREYSEAMCAAMRCAVVSTESIVSNTDCNGIDVGAALDLERQMALDWLGAAAVEPSGTKPAFDDETGTIYWRGAPIHQFRKGPSGQRDIIRGMEAAGWPASGIESPVAERSVGNALKRLNSNITTATGGVQPFRFVKLPRGRIGWEIICTK